MMNGHPGGAEHSLKMLKLSGLKVPAKILDMGAGTGKTVRLLRQMGFDAFGIDLEPSGEGVIMADMLNAPFEDMSFDGIISECAFFKSGDPDGAMSAAHRLLRPKGILMLSDVWFQNAAEAAGKAGFTVLAREDMTSEWREYYLEALWRGDAAHCDIKGKCTYEMLICRKD